MRVGVVGGGVVGLATGHYLQKLGADPIIVEAGGVGGGCSRGNNGWVCPSVVDAAPGAGPDLEVAPLDAEAGQSLPHPGHGAAPAGPMAVTVPRLLHGDCAHARDSVRWHR